MNVQQALSYFVNWLLRLGVIAFLIPFFLEFWSDPGSDDPFWSWFLKIAYLIVFIVFVLLVLSMKRLRFYNLGFSLIMIGSVYKILDLGFKYGIHTEQANYFLLIVVSLYFMTKRERKKQRRY